MVCFTERLATLHWLHRELPALLKMSPDAFAVLHGGLPDKEQMAVVEQFGLAGAPIRVLLTGDVASEGVNLHRQCHQLVHIDSPWSLIRIEQRNGRIDRYGQTETPKIDAFVVQSSHETFSADVRVLSKLLLKEHAAHKALGDAASLMRLHDPDAEEESVKKALAEGRNLDDVVPDPHTPGDADGDDDWSFEELFADAGEQAPPVERPVYPEADTWRHGRGPVAQIIGGHRDREPTTANAPNSADVYPIVAFASSLKLARPVSPGPGAGASGPDGEIPIPGTLDGISPGSVDPGPACAGAPGATAAGAGLSAGAGAAAG